ncbi:MAG: radical SAM protein [Candidatus Omnitrophica bacterium]|nr:radical SAM protein [Candidatus Omnitrophota bacterium]
MKKIKAVFVKYMSLFIAGFSIRKITNFCKVMLSYFLRKTKVSGLPFLLQIEPTNRCDLRCSLCLTGAGKLKRSRGDMSFKQFKNIVSQLQAGLIYIVLYNLGEPLLNPDIYQMIKYAKKKRIFTRLSTNANFSDRAHIKSILTSGLDELVISLDCASEETYRAYKKSTDFCRVLDNVSLLIKERGQRLKPFINLQFLLMGSTEQEIDEFKKLIKDLGVDKGLIKKVRVDYFAEKPEYGLLPENKKFHRDIYRGKGKKNPCVRPWISTLVLWDGVVVPCCFDMEGDFILGNVKGGKITRIWNDKEYMNLRHKIASKSNSAELCRQCSLKNFSSNFIK